VSEAKDAVSLAAAVEKGIYIGQLVNMRPPPLRVHLIIGHPIEKITSEEGELQHRLWIGFAMQML
jgi:hypothetical protein